MKILVTGADGFIGSHLTEALVRAGHDVKAFVLYNSFNSWGWLDKCADDIKGKFEVFSGDIRDTNGVREAVKDCDAVILVTAPEKLRIQRTIDRDNTDELSVRERIKNQLSDEIKKKSSNFIINNIKLENTLEEIDKIIEILNNS